MCQIHMIASLRNSYPSFDPSPPENVKGTNKLEKEGLLTNSWKVKVIKIII